MSLRLLRLTGGLVLALVVSYGSAQTKDTRVLVPLPTPSASSSVTNKTSVASVVPIDPNLPSYNTATTPLVSPVIPTPPIAPVESHLYAGAGATFGSNGAYGIVIGSSQLFNSFGAQATVEYSAKTGAMLVDALLTLRLRQFNRGKLRPYLGAGLGLSSSVPVNSMPTTVNGITTTNSSVTDYTAQVLIGSDYMFTQDIAAYGEAGFRHAFSSKGTADGAGGLARLGLKFFF